MRARFVRFALLTALALGFWTGCATKDSDGAKKFVNDYWTRVFKGDARKAYGMLTGRSKRRLKYKEYAENIAFGTKRTAVKDSFFEVYAPACSVGIGPAMISGDTAVVEVLLTIPDLPNLNRTTLLPKADSLFGQKDSLARNEWLLRERTKAIRNKHYRPLIMHLTLRLAWEWFNWHLIYE